MPNAPLTPGQVRSLDAEADYDPALNPDDGSSRVRMGTRLATMGAAVAAIPDATDLATALVLVNGIKAELVAAFSQE